MVSNILLATARCQFKYPCPGVFVVPRLQLHYATAIRLLANRDTTERKYREVTRDTGESKGGLRKQRMLKHPDAVTSGYIQHIHV